MPRVRTEVEYAAYMDLVVNAAAILTTVPVTELLATIDQATTLGPLLHPAAFQHGGGDRLTEQRRLLEAAAGLQRVARELGLGNQVASPHPPRGGNRAMTGRIVALGTRPHACNPGWQTRPCTGHDDCPITDPHDHAYQVAARVSPGTVWECDCGRTFVAFYLRDPDPRKVSRGGLVDLTAHWRPEGWWERRRRLRRERRAAETAEREAGKQREAR